MMDRKRLHRLVDDLPEDEVETALHVLEALADTGGDDPLMRRLLRDLIDDELLFAQPEEASLAWEGGVPPPAS